MATGYSFFSAAFCRFFCGLWHGFCKIWKITGSPPEINFRADSGGRIPPKQIIYVRSGGNFFCCRTKNDKHSCHFSSKLLKSRPFCSPLKPEKIKTGGTIPPIQKKTAFSGGVRPPLSGKRRQIRGTADGEEDIYQKIFSRFIFSLATRKSSCSARAFSSPDELETSSASTYFMAFAMHWSISSSSSELMNIRATSW